MSDAPAQVEDGYVRIANALFDAYLRALPRLSKQEAGVFMAVVRRTYGWRRKAAPMTATTLSELTGFDPSDCRKAVRALVANGLLRSENQGKKNQILGPNKTFSEWFNGGNHPVKGGGERPVKSQKGGGNHPASKNVPGEITPHLVGENAPDKRGKSPRMNRLQPTDGAASSDPKDSKDILKTSTNSPSESYTRARGINVTVQAMTEALPGLSESVARDYLAHRRGLKAPLTPTAWNQIAKAVTETGAPPDDCLAHAMVQGWRGFKADWWANAQRGSRARSPQTFDKQDYSEGLEAFAAGMEIS